MQSIVNVNLHFDMRLQRWLQVSHDSHNYNQSFQMLEWTKNLKFCEVRPTSRPISGTVWSWGVRCQANPVRRSNGFPGGRASYPALEPIFGCIKTTLWFSVVLINEMNLITTALPKIVRGPLRARLQEWRWKVSFLFKGNEILLSFKC